MAGWLDKVLGRSEPAQPDLDALFALPPAALTLQAALGLAPTGAGAVCYKAAEGASFAGAQAQVRELLDADAGPEVEISRDAYGYSWLEVRGDPADLPGLVTQLHAVNAGLADAGFGAALLCTIVPFAPAPGAAGAEAAEGEGAARRLAMVYLYKQGTWYPFAPTGDSQRDNAFELQVSAHLAGELKIEPDLGRWFPVWGAPGL
jgi:hypothetical protein